MMPCRRRATTRHNVHVFTDPAIWQSATVTYGGFSPLTSSPISGKCEPTSRSKASTSSALRLRRPDGREHAAGDVGEPEGCGREDGDVGLCRVWRDHGMGIATVPLCAHAGGRGLPGSGIASAGGRGHPVSAAYFWGGVAEPRLQWSGGELGRVHPGRDHVPWE